jgi:hypothetical protein
MKSIKIILFTFALCSLFFVICPIWMPSAQAQIQFERAFGGTGYDQANSIVQTTDGGYAVAGVTNSFGAGNYDFYIVKLDGSGNPQWSKTVGGTGDDEVSPIIRTTDGGYAVAGFTNSFGAGGYDFYIVKLSSTGGLQWSKTVGGTGTDEVSSIVQTTDGGYAVAGVTNSFGAGGYDFYIVKLSSTGGLQWSKTVGGTGTDEVSSIIQTTDGGYAVAGYTTSFGAGNYDMYIMKLDVNGNIQWSKTVGGINADYASCVIQTSDGGYAAAGETNSFGAGNNDMYIVKLSSNGGLQWTRTVGGTSFDYANSIIQTTDGGYAVAGSTTSYGAGNNDMYIVKLDGSGNLQWSRTVGGSNAEYGYSIVQTTDGGYTLAGTTTSFGMGSYDMFVVKLDAGGNTCANTTSPSSISGSGGYLGSPTVISNSSSPTVTSPSSSSGTGGTVTSICTFVEIQPVSNEIPASYELFQNYPNPFNPTTKFKIQISKLSDTKVTVFDVLGKEVAILVDQQLKPGTYEVEWDASNYPSGVYFYKLTADDYLDVKKMVLIK